MYRKDQAIWEGNPPMLSSGRKNFGKFAGSSAARQQVLAGREGRAVLCNLLSLHFGAESHQPGIRGVPTEILLAQPIVTASMFKISDSSEQLGNVKKLRSF